MSKPESNKKILQLVSILKANPSEEVSREALKELEALESLHNKQSDILALKALAYRLLKEPEKTISCIQQLLLKKTPNNYFSEEVMSNFLAESYKEAGQYQAAYDEYLVLSQKYPDRKVDYTYYAALIAVQQDQEENAIRLLEKCLALNPDHAPSLCELGQVYYHHHLYHDAYRLLCKASLQNFKKPELFYYMGASLLKLGKNYNDALKTLEKCLKIPKWEIRVLPKISKIHLLLGNYQEAIQLLREYLKAGQGKLKREETKELCSQLALVYEANREFENAYEIWQKVAQIDPENTTEAYKQIEIYKKFIQDPRLRLFLRPCSKKLMDLCLTISKKRSAENYKKDSLSEILEQNYGYLVVQPNTLIKGPQEGFSLHLFFLYKKFPTKDLLAELLEDYTGQVIHSIFIYMLNEPLEDLLFDEAKLYIISGPEFLQEILSL